MRIRRPCPKSHQYWKSPDCPTCPVCVAACKPAAAFMEGLSAPARRALEGAGLTILAKLSRNSGSQVLELQPGIEMAKAANKTKPTRARPLIGFAPRANEISLPA